MSTQADIVLADGQSTPANHTFSKRGATMNLARYADIASGVMIGQPILTIGNAQTGKPGSGAWRTEIRIVKPVLEVISGSDGGYTPQPKVAYNLFAKIELVAPDRSALADRKDILAFAKNVLTNAQVTSSFHDFDVPT